jgi:septum formation topological specificity factor MinE
MRSRKNFPSTSGKIARARAHLTVSCDRLSCNQEALLQMQRELQDVLSKYFNLDKDVYEMRLEIVYRTKRGVQDAKTIQIK